RKELDGAGAHEGRQKSGALRGLGKIQGKVHLFRSPTMGNRPYLEPRRISRPLSPCRRTGASSQLLRGRMTVNDIVGALGRTVLFHGLGESDLKRLAAIARLTSLPSGAVLFNQGDESDGLYVITAGIVRIYLTSSDGREATINLAEEGEVIGEMALLDGLSRSAGAAALTATQLVFIPREPFLALLESSTKLARQIILTLCERLRATNAQV